MQDELMQEMLLEAGVTFHDREGRLISFDEWAKLKQDLAYTQIGLDELTAHTRVSTIWVGVDLRGWAQGTPLIFETMIFSDDDTLNLRAWRAATEEEAIKYHHDTVEFTRAVLEAKR